MQISKFNKWIFEAIVFSIFLTSYYFRLKFVQSISVVNFIFCLALALFLLINRKKIDILRFVLVTLSIIYAFSVDYLGNSNNLNIIIKGIFTFFIPMYFITVNSYGFERKEIIKSVIKIFNFFTIIIFVIGLVDPLTNLSIMKYLGEHFFEGVSNWICYYPEANIYRYVSFMGHPLVTKEIFIYYYLFNTIYRIKFKESIMNDKLVMAISLIGNLLTSSKVGLVIIIISFIIFYDGKNKFRNIAFILLVVIAAYSLGLFDTIILRFQSTTLTTGRSESWQAIQELDFLKPKFFSGYGEDIYHNISDVVGEVQATAGTEYPFRILLYKYGVVCLCMAAFICVVYPIYFFVRRKEYYILVAFIIKFLDVMSYNGLVYKPDNMILFVLFTFILMIAAEDKTKISSKV